MKLYRFGSHLYDESKDKDVVIISDTVPHQLTKENDLHVLHPDTLEPTYPETATKVPNLVKLCMKYCSEIPKPTRDNIQVNYDDLITEIRNVHVNALEMFINFLLSKNSSYDSLIMLLSKYLFKLIQTNIIYHHVNKLKNDENKLQKLFYKTGLLNLFYKYNHNPIEKVEYDPKKKILYISDDDFVYDNGLEVRNAYLNILDDLLVRSFFKNTTITLRINDIGSIVHEVITESGNDVKHTTTVEEYLKFWYELPDTFHVKNNKEIIVYEEYYVGTVWGV